MVFAWALRGLLYSALEAYVRTIVVLDLALGRLREFLYHIMFFRLAYTPWTIKLFGAFESTRFDRHGTETCLIWT